MSEESKSIKPSEKEKPREEIFCVQSPPEPRQRRFFRKRD